MTGSESLDLLLNIDRLVDEARDENQLALSLTTLFAQTFSADLALLAIPGSGPDGSPQPHAVLDRTGILDRLPGGTLAGLLQDAASRTGERAWASTLEVDGETVHTLTTGLRSHGDMLGVLLAGRRGSRFSPHESELFQTGVTLLDHALRAWVTFRRYQQEALTLRTIQRIDIIQDTATNMEELLDGCLAELSSVVPAEVGYIFLYDRTGKRLDLRAVTDRELLSQHATLERVYAAADEAVSSGQPVQRVYPDGPVRALIGFPLILNKRVFGVLGVLNRERGSDFSPDDYRLIQAIASQVDTAIFERLQAQRLRESFGRNVGPQVMDRLMQIDDRDLLNVERVEVATLFSDMRGFTAASGSLASEQLERMINSHLDAMAEVVLEHEGTLDKFLGDGLMAIFNAPVRQPDFVRQAVRTALAMQRAHVLLMERWQAQGLPALPVGIGLTTGEVLVGNFGSNAHAEYSAVGPCVNLAARLCAAADGGQILVDQDTYDLLAGEIIARPVTPLDLKGFTEPVAAYEVEGLFNHE